MDWAGILNPLIGTLVGAGLAFLSNWFFQHKAQVRDNLAAGRRALFTIDAQFQELANYRYAMRHAISIVHKAMPEAAVWMFAKPMGYNFNPSNVFDFKALVFLLSTKSGREAFGRLQFVERTYLDFVARHTDLNASAQELQKAMAPIHREKGNISIPEMEKQLGLELTTKVRSHLQAVVLRTDRDEERYKKAYIQHNKVMFETFGKDVRMPELSMTEKFTNASLPPLPASLVTYLNSIPLVAN